MRVRILKALKPGEMRGLRNLPESTNKFQRSLASISAMDSQAMDKPVGKGSCPSQGPRWHCFNRFLELPRFTAQRIYKCVQNRHTSGMSAEYLQRCLKRTLFKSTFCDWGYFDYSFWVACLPVFYSIVCEYCLFYL